MQWGSANVWLASSNLLSLNFYSAKPAGYPNMDVNYQRLCNKVDRLQLAFSIERANAPCYTAHINVVHYCGGNRQIVYNCEMRPGKVAAAL